MGYHFVEARVGAEYQNIIPLLEYWISIAVLYAQCASQALANSEPWNIEYLVNGNKVALCQMSRVDSRILNISLIACYPPTIPVVMSVQQQSVGCMMM